MVAADVSDNVVISGKDILNIADRKANRMLEIIGIKPSHTQSQFVQNIFNQDNRLLVSGEYNEYLAWKQSQDTEHVFNVTPDSVEDKG